MISSYERLRSALQYGEPTPQAENTLHSAPEPDIMQKRDERTPNVQKVGRIDPKIFEDEFGKLQTDEVVLTNEREEHIKERHSQDYSYFDRYGADAVNNPDIIMSDSRHESTAFLVKRLPETNLNVVVRLALETDSKELKNSIMTFHRVRDSYLKKMLERNKVLYKRE